MATPGKKPKPNRGNGLKGNTADNSLPPTPFENEENVNTSCPKWLDKHGKEFWDEHVPRLTEEGLFKNVDRTAFEMMANCYSQFRKAQAIIDKQGLTFKSPNGYVQQRPEVGMVNKARETLRLYLEGFGMTASSRTRIGGGNGGGGGEGEDWKDTGIDE